MPIRSRCTVAGLMVGVGLLLAASCGDEPGTPSGPPNAPIITTTSLAIAGPENVAPGASAQFNATAQRSDGTTLNATNQVNWSSSNTFYLTISSAGIATGRNRGEVTITAVSGAVRSTRVVLVLTDGTFRVVGHVDEVGLPTTIPLPGAAIQVTGPTGNFFTVTDGSGRYRLYGISGDTEIRATKPAYRDHTQRIVVTDHQTVDFELRTTVPIPQLQGSYTLTISASARCREALPEAARVRIFAAAVVQSDVRALNVSLSGATFVGTSNQFTGRIDPGTIAFTLGYYYYYGYYGGISERLGTQLLHIAGVATTQESGNRIAGTLSGGIRLTTDRNVHVAACYATDHQFEFRR